MNQALTDERAARDWVAENAVPLAPAARPEALAEAIGEAVITGFGESTRASHEILDLGHRLLRLLVAEKGYRALALSDDESVIAELDEYARTGLGDVKAILANAFVAWRITELVEIVEWLRTYNIDHPDDPVRIFGLEPATIRLGHYDEVLDQVRGIDPELAERVASRYDTIRTAHRLPEHVQTAQGVHPGRPFAELAREAVDLLKSLGDHPAVVVAERIAHYHSATIAAGYDFEDGNRRSAQVIIDWRESTGHKIFYWEGMAFTANAPRIGIRQMRAMADNTGSRLRERYGSGYVSIVAGFDHGVIHAGVRVPEPPSDFADAVVGCAEPETYLLDLRMPKPEPVTRWLGGDHKLRVIAGIYKPEEDAEHHLTGGPLDEWFDVIIRFREITPTTRL